MNKKALAKETLEIIDQGQYTTEDQLFDLKSDINKSIDESVLLKPGVELKVKTFDPKDTVIEVKNCTTLEACQAISKEATNIFCLNFASAKNPGGGFQNGAEAQEESLARSSTLYPTLMENYEMYEENRKKKSCIYLEYMIYSPGCWVFRNDKGKLLGAPYKVDFLTAPAVNAGIVNTREPENVGRIESVMDYRIKRCLSVALENNHTHLILGAWGCGVFKNDPEMIARLFHKYLNSCFKGAFEYINFAVLDRRERGIFSAFENQFLT